MGKVKSRIAFAISPVAIENEWQRQTTAAAIAGARQVIGEAIPPGTPIGRLSDTEWDTSLLR
jgi:hypothetical protein